MSSELLDDFSPRYIGDTSDVLEIHFIDKNQNTYPITNYTPGSFTLKLVSRQPNGPTIVGTGTWNVVDVNNGIVNYTFSSADVSTIGNFDIVVGVTLPAGPKHFVPKVLEILPLT